MVNDDAKVHGCEKACGEQSKPKNGLITPKISKGIELNKYVANYKLDRWYRCEGWFSLSNGFSGCFSLIFEKALRQSKSHCGV